MDVLPDNKIVDLHDYLFEPLSTIIKLAILSNKPIGTKICMDKNIMYLQEPGFFQGFCRKFITKSTKSDLQYLFNPIEFACRYYLTKDMIPLFKTAQLGLNRLIDTYKSCAMIRLSLLLYDNIIRSYLLKIEMNKENDYLFQKDNITDLYSTELLDKFRHIWDEDRIIIIQGLISFLQKDTNSNLDVHALQVIMDRIDSDVKKLFNN